MKIRHEIPHTVSRAAAYPPIGDQLDMLWKWVATLPKDIVTTELAAGLTQIKDVKERYPVNTSARKPPVRTV